MVPREEASEFEDQVRHIARIRWPGAEFSGASKPIGTAQERDGVFETEDIIHIVEATVSRQRDKARQDAEKTRALIRLMRKSRGDKPIRGWVVTRNEPTADQREAVDKFKSDGIRICSFAQFTAPLVDAPTYLQIRMDRGFGSARNLEEISDFKNVGDYVELNFLQDDPPETGATSKVWSFESILEVVDDQKYKNIVFIGDFGSGKSMTLREIFMRLRTNYFRDPTNSFPVYLNLRDHWGQRNPVEVLERHARELGYPNERQLVRAWRAGFIVLILDGFDEVAAEGWTGKGERLSQLRRSAMEMVRRFVSESPSEVTVILAGRSSFFDSRAEMSAALGTGKGALYLTLNDFSNEQIEDYLRRLGVTADIPDWLPSRPLLVGHLATRGILQDVLSNGAQSRAEGWDSLLQMIAEREASIEANIYPEELRQILERVATNARSKQDGLGPIDAAEIFETFNSIVGRPPDDAARVLLLRLPGLGPYSGANIGSRAFVDEDLADTARAGDVSAYCVNAHDPALGPLARANSPIGTLGASVAALHCGRRQVGGQQISAAMEVASMQGWWTVAADCYQVLEGVGEPYTGHAVCVRDVHIPQLDLAEVPKGSARVLFSGCYFDRVFVPLQVDESQIPRFSGCLIEAVVGRVGRDDLPKGLFDKACEISSFSSFDRTTDSIMQLSVPVGIKVLLTVLKKLFLQAGSGRQENALLRGLDQNARSLVIPVLSILEAAGLAKPWKLDRRTVWIPNRSQYSRVFAVLQAPSSATDSIVLKAAKL